MNEILKKISEYGIIPVIKIDDVKDALPLAKALCKGGLPVAEITYRTACAKEAIEIIAKELPEMLVGAGTVLTCGQADSAIEAGAQFIISPGLNPRVVKHCIDRGVTVTPGCSSPTDVEAALELGLDTVKFFPAEAAGGLPMIKAMSAPYPNVKFIPTGGINEANLLSYLKFSKILACGGSFMVRDEYIKKGEFGKITELTRNAVSLMFGFELKHIGVNLPDSEQAAENAALMQTMFGFAPQERSGAVFSGDAFEFMKTNYLGTHGHIAIATNFIGRAVSYFENMGYAFNKDELKFDEKGELAAAYFSDEFFGFALHLVQKK